MLNEPSGGRLVHGEPRLRSPLCIGRSSWERKEALLELPDTPTHGSRVPGHVVQRVRRAIQRNPRLSIRQIGIRTGAPRSTIQRILRRELQLHAFKMQVLHSLKRGDKARRVRFCRWMLRQWSMRGFRKNLVMSDEAHFYLNGAVNKQNCRIWGEKNPHM